MDTQLILAFIGLGSAIAYVFVSRIVRKRRHKQLLDEEVATANRVIEIQNDLARLAERFDDFSSEIKKGHFLERAPDMNFFHILERVDGFAEEATLIAVQKFQVPRIRSEWEKVQQQASGLRRKLISSATRV